MPDRGSSGSRRAAALWSAGFAGLGVAAVARNLIGLDAAPPGMYVDEASIGYNAWAIAQHGVDEHGYHIPLYFQAFGEYKNPVYIYALVPFLRVLPLTPVVERLPAAMFGALALLFVTLAAWRLSRSRRIAMLVLVLAGLTPWLTQESRVGFEVISMVAALAAAIWCLAADGALSRRRLAAAGVCLAIAVFAYSTGRVEILLFAVVFAAVYWRCRGWWLALVPVAAAYAVLGVWAALHPGALTVEFRVVNIGADGAQFRTLASRFLANYGSYFSPDFLFIHGDPNPRHNTGYAGMLLAAMAPLLLAGLVVCWRRRRERLPQLTVMCLLLAPLAGAITYPAPHALRGADMLPFLFLLAGYGMLGIRDAVGAIPPGRGRAALPAVLCAGAVAQGALFTADMYTAYPTRAAAAFDAGALPAMTVAARAAHGHEVYISSSLNEAPYIDAFMALLPPPPQHPVDDAAGRGLNLLGMAVTDAPSADRAARPGDVLVLAASDPAPPAARIIAAERAPVDPLNGAAGGEPLVLVYLVT